MHPAVHSKPHKTEAANNGLNVQQDVEIQFQREQHNKARQNRYRIGSVEQRTVLNTRSIRFCPTRNDREKPEELAR